MPLAESSRYKLHQPVVSTDTFLVTFPIFSTEDLRVVVDGVDTLAFSVTATFVSGTSTDAAIVLVDAVTDVDVEIYGDRAARAESDYIGNSPNLAAQIQLDTERTTAVQQEQARDFTRSLKLPSNATQSKEIAASTGPFHVLASNADNTGYEFVPAADAGVTFDPALFVAKAEVGSVAQAWDADLDALASQSGTGIMARTGAATYALRAIAGTADRIAVTNGTGVSGNPTIDVVKASTANAEAGTGDGVMDPVLTKAAIDAQTIGADQTVTEYTIGTGRVGGTSYQNTTGKPIAWAISFKGSGATRLAQTSPDGVTWSSFCVAATGTHSASCFIVPTGWYYRINGATETGGTFDIWTELS